MRLSEAIRLGAMTGPQAFGAMYANDGSVCAMGAAYLAVGILEGLKKLVHGTPAERVKFVRDNTEWGDLIYRTDVACPVCRRRDDWLPIPHLNDDHRWSRERIADFVELHEPLPLSEPLPLPEKDSVSQ